jgi:hypothetical protein
MPQKEAATPAAYLASVEPTQRKQLETVRRVIKRSLPKGYREGMNWGAIVYEVPLSSYPDTYNGRPLCYVALAAQKGYCSLYLMGVYGSRSLKEELQNGFRSAGKKLKMGKSCVRFRAADELPLDVIGGIVAKVPVDEFIARAEDARSARKKPRA